MSSKYYYLDLSLEFEKTDDREVNAAFFKKHLVQSVRQLFGESASFIDIDLLKYSSDKKRAILRVPRDYYVKVRSSLTLVGQYDGSCCEYRIHKTSPLLLSLVGDSREFTH